MWKAGSEFHLSPCALPSLGTEWAAEELGRGGTGQPAEKRHRCLQANLTPCILVKICQEIGRRKVSHVDRWQRWSFGVHIYFPTPLNKVGESVFKSMCIRLTVVSENKCLSQLTKVITSYFTLKLYCKCNTEKVLKCTFLLISINEKFRFRKIFNILLALNLSTWCLQFLIYPQTLAFNYKKGFSSVGVSDSVSIAKEPVGQKGQGQWETEKWLQFLESLLMLAGWGRLGCSSVARALACCAQGPGLTPVSHQPGMCYPSNPST